MRICGRFLFSVAIMLDGLETFRREKNAKFTAKQIPKNGQNL